MLKGFVRLAVCTASSAAFLALTGCGGAAPDDGYAGPPPTSYDRTGPSPTLMGAAAAPAQPTSGGLLGGPGDRAGMAPIPNPGDLTRAERVRFYGHKYDHLPEPRGGAVAASDAPRFQLVTRRRSDGTLEIAMRPIANPEDMTAAERRQVYGNRYAPRAVVAAAPRRAARPVAAPAAVAATVAPRPVAKVAPAAPAKAAPVQAAKPAMTPAQQLQAAVSAEARAGAALSVPADLKAGKEANVVLSLPGDLLAKVQAQAAKLGLGKAAKKVDAYATLKGDGYEIAPKTAQTAAVAAGKPTTFSWSVKPGAGEKAPLTADYGLTLKGAKPAFGFSLGSIQEAIAAPVEAAKKAGKGFKLPSLKMPNLSLKALAFPWVPELNIPGVGSLAREKLVGGLLALLALVLVVVLARGAGANRARAERRRKFRTMQDYGHNEMEPAAQPTAASQGYVNPMVATPPSPDDHGQDSHGHDDHGHDDHGHAEPDHAYPAHPVAHAPEADHGDHAAAGHDGHGHDDHAPDSHAAPAHDHDDHAPQPVSHPVEASHDEPAHPPAHDDHDGHRREPEHAH